MRREGGGGGTPAAAADLIRIIRSKREEGLFVQEVTYPKGSTLYTENEPAYYAYLIAEGFVDLVKRTPGGKRFILDRRGPGELLGIEALAGERNPLRAFCAEAATDVRALLLDLPAWEELLGERASHRAALQLFGRMLLHKDLRIGMLLSNGAPERIRAAKAYLQYKFSGDLPPLTRRELAQFVGCTPETVCKRKSVGASAR